MAVYDYLALYNRIEAVVYDNTTKAIKAETLQQLLKDIVDSNSSLEYNEDRTYEIGAFCVYDDGTGYRGYICTAQTTGAFTGGDWGQLGV
jgi:hypothetical protein